VTGNLYELVVNAGNENMISEEMKDGNIRICWLRAFANKVLGDWNDSGETR